MLAITLTKLAQSLRILVCSKDRYWPFAVLGIVENCAYPITASRHIAAIHLAYFSKM